VWADLHIRSAQQLRCGKSKFIGWRAIDKPLEEENGCLSGDGTRTILRVGTVAEPPHQSLAGDLCRRAQLACLSAAIGGITSCR